MFENGENFISHKCSLEIRICWLYSELRQSHNDLFPRFRGCFSLPPAACKNRCLIFNDLATLCLDCTFRPVGVIPKRMHLHVNQCSTHRKGNVREQCLFIFCLQVIFECGMTLNHLLSEVLQSRCRLNTSMRTRPQTTYKMEKLQTNLADGNSGYILLEEEIANMVKKIKDNHGGTW